MEIITTNALISINETAIVQLVSFLIFLYIMNRVMFRPLRNVMEKRSNYIEKLLQDINNAEKVFDNLTLEIKEKKNTARMEALGVKSQLDAAANYQAEQISNEAKEKVNALFQDTEVQIKDQLNTARLLIPEEATAVMTKIMEKILNRRLA